MPFRMRSSASCYWWTRPADDTNVSRAISYTSTDATSSARHAADDSTPTRRVGPQRVQPACRSLAQQGARAGGSPRETPVAARLQRGKTWVWICRAEHSRRRSGLWTLHSCHVHWAMIEGHKHVSLALRLRGCLRPRELVTATVLVAGPLCVPAAPGHLREQPRSNTASGFSTLSARADAAREAGRLDEAVSLYRRALALRADWKEGWWAVGTILYDQDSHAEAASAFRRLLVAGAHRRHRALDAGALRVPDRALTRAR